MPTYDAVLFDPPAPVASVVLRNQESGATWADVPMLLDSGADVTLVPRAVVDRIGVAIAPTKRYELIGFNGSTSFSQVVQLDLVLLGRTFRGQFLLIDQDWGILGRNIMNALALLLDGPTSAWDEFHPGQSSGQTERIGRRRT